jgi:hypothetical protein
VVLLISCPSSLKSPLCNEEYQKIFNILFRNEKNELTQNREELWEGISGGATGLLFHCIPFKII